MSSEARSLEEIKQEIKRKQALLFEKRLDAYLALEDSNLPIAERKRIFNELLDPVSEENSPEQTSTSKTRD